MSCQHCVETLVCHICGGRGRSDASGVPTVCRACGGSGVCATCGVPVSGGRLRQHDGPLTAAEAGTVGNSPLVHAVAKTLNGNKARCGAGHIGATLTGRFEPDSAASCPDCGLQ